MYNIIEQHNNSTSRSTASTTNMLNDTSKPVITTTSAGYKIDCAKECPCGVPVIPVPDQWLEVMVTGGFKVWHIIFIIIAFLVTMVVVYCCFHRCRIPRTKQEIEADLMRSNLTTKFREYLQEFPNEPTTFLEALKRVQDLEEKSNEQDDAGAKKRKFWLKSRGKDRQEGDKVADEAKVAEATLPTDPAPIPVAGDGPHQVSDKPSEAATSESTAKENKEAETIDATKSDQQGQQDDKSQIVGATNNTTQSKKVKSKKTHHSKIAHTFGKATSKTVKSRQDSKPEGTPETDKQDKTKGEKEAAPALAQVEAMTPNQTDLANAPASNRPARARRKRDKPNLSRTKATHAGSRGESTETSNVLTLPVVSHHHHHHHQQQQQQQHQQHHVEFSQGANESSKPVVTTSGHRRAHSKAKDRKDATVIRIDTSPPPDKTKRVAK